MNILYAIPFLFMSLGLFGCSSVEKVETETTMVDVQIIKPHKPNQIVLMPLDFTVLTTENSHVMLKDNNSLVCLSTTGYKNLALNTQEMKRYMEGQKSLIQYYEKVTTK